MRARTHALMNSTFTFNSLHATDLYIDFMNNSLAKKEIMKRKKKERKKVTERVYELKTNA